MYLCPNALLLEGTLGLFTASPDFAFVAHLDGLRERQDASVDKAGTFDAAVAAVRTAHARGAG